MTQTTPVRGLMMAGASFETGTTIRPDVVLGFDRAFRPRDRVGVRRFLSVHPGFAHAWCALTRQSIGGKVASDS